MFGFKVNGNQITSIETGTEADKNGRIRSGDKIYNINGVEIFDSTSHDTVVDFIRKSGNTISLDLKRGNIAT